MSNEAAEQIKNGFNAMAGGVKEAGKKRINELIEKQGYVAYKNKEAAQLFKNNPDYYNWVCQVVDGEYRFYPPIEKTKNEINIIDTYKEAKNDPKNNTFVSIKILDGSPEKCEYKLIKTDKKTGQKQIIQSEVFETNQKFWMETLPSLYYHLCNGLPVIDYEKEKSMNYSSIDGKNTLLIGNLNKNRLDLIKNMQNYIDEKMNYNIDDKKVR